MIAGILNIISGIFFLVVAISFVNMRQPVAKSMVSYVMYSMGLSGMPDTSFTHFVVVVMGAVLIIFSIISILGGVYAVRRRFWVMALAGSIPAIIYLAPTGILSIKLTALSRKEFRTGGKP